MVLKFRHYFWVLGLMLISLNYAEKHRQCGTALLFSSNPSETALFKQSLTSKIRPPEAVRKYETDHFVFFYKIKGPHHIRLNTNESQIITDYDNIFNGLDNSLSDSEKEKQTYDQLNQGNFSHPMMIQKYGEHFEIAWNHYVVTLGMKAPSSPGASFHFNQPQTSSKYTVEVVDIVSTNSRLNNFFVYGMTFPGSASSIIVENDFIEADQDTIIPFATYNNFSINYSEEWEKAIKITAIHEFYHSIQFSYTPNVSTYNYWYELSATGMEEILAGDVNDYWQYLPFVFEDQTVLRFNDPGDTDLHTYGRGIFFQFLIDEMGQDFDVNIWDKMLPNGPVDSLIIQTIVEKGYNPVDLFSKFTLLFFNNRSTNTFSISDFTPDRENWPKVSIKSINSLGVNNNFTLRTLTYDFATVDSGLFNNMLSVNLILGEDVTLTPIVSDSNHSTISVVSGTPFLLPLNQYKGKTLTLHMSNNSWGNEANLTLRVFPQAQDSVIRAFPTSVNINSLNNVFFTKLPSPDSVYNVQIYSDHGDSVKTLTLLESEYTWVWDLKDHQGKMVPPGVYYYRVEDQELKTIYLYYSDS